MTTTINTNWRSLVMQADPEFAKDSRIVREYEFSAPGGRRLGGQYDELYADGMRIFKGDYQNRGPYAPD